MALTTVEAVTKRLEGEVTPDMEIMIGEYLEDASDQAIYYGEREWTEATCPASVKRIIANAVARFMRNPDGLSQSRAGDETMAWQDVPEAGAVYFSPQEIERLQRIGNPRLKSFGTFGTVAHGKAPIKGDLIWPVGNGKPIALLHPRERA